MNKRIVRVLWDCRSGSVNVFLIGITAAMVFFMAVLIDFARIAAFERMAETAVYSGVRSALSAYDGTLQSEYGLFARGGTDSGEIFARVAAAALKPQDADRSFRLLHTDISDSGVTAGDSLAIFPVLERQILEEMKYKAPIDFTLELADRFGAVSSKLEESARTVDLLSRLQQLFDSRQRHLEEALRHQRNAAEAVSSSGMAPIVPYGASSGTTASSAAYGYETYVGWVKAEAERREREAAWRRQVEEQRRQWEAACAGRNTGRGGDGAGMEEGAAEDGCGAPPEVMPIDLGPSYAAEIDAYARSAREAASRLASAAAEGLTEHDHSIASARQALEAAAAVNKRMAEIVESAKRQAESSAPDGGEGQSGEIGGVLNETDRLLLDDSWFDAYRRELAEQQSAAAELPLWAGTFRAAVGQALADVDIRHAAGLKETSQTLRDKYGQYAAEYIGPSGSPDYGRVIAARAEAIEALNAADAERRQFERQAEESRGEAGKLLRRIAQLPSDEESEREFAKLRKRYEESMALNEAAETSSAVPAPGELDDNSGEYEKRAANKSAGLFGGLDGMLLSMRDELYLNEYAVSRFTSFRPQLLADWIPDGAGDADGTGTEGAERTGNAAGADAADDAEGSGRGTDGRGEKGPADLLMSVSTQEVEYILYGIHQPAANLAAAYAEIFAVRVAIRLMEGLVECRKYGHPLVVFAAAIAYSLAHAVKDMLQLIKTGETELSKWVRINISYRDYLRLFLMLHGSNAEKLARITALIEYRTGYRLREMPAALTGYAQASVNLWFLPGVMKLFSAGGILQGKVVDGRYETTVVAGSSY